MPGGATGYSSVPSCQCIVLHFDRKGNVYITSCSLSLGDALIQEETYRSRDHRCYPHKSEQVLKTCIITCYPVDCGGNRPETDLNIPFIIPFIYFIFSVFEHI